MDGTGDFARILGAALWERHGIRSHFLVYRQPKQALDVAEIAPCTISYCAESSPAACADALESVVREQSFQTALLHYGPYSYSFRGTPGEFARMMAEASRKLNLHVFVHETWAEGPPWKRAFWTRREQQQSLGLLVRSSRSSFTSTPQYIDRLKQVSPGSEAATRVRIFSNMGEIEDPPAVAERERRLVIFGQLVTRLRIYRRRERLEELCRGLRVTSIADVGSGTDASIPEEIAGVKVARLGRLEEAEVSKLLATSLAGAVEYPPEYWAKSGVIAAYAAHGIVPIFFSETGKFASEKEVPFMDVRDLLTKADAAGAIPDGVLQAVADRAHQLYVEHQSVARCADLVAAQVLR